MKKHLLSLILLGAFAFQGFSQTTKPPTTDSKEYEQMKLHGKIPEGMNITNAKSFAPTLEDLKRLGVTHKIASSGCGCYQAPDATYTLAMAPNDDGSTASIAIPFSFCLYGTTFTSLFINNNGNVSFGTSFSTFSALGFPSSSFQMVAPFWGDVDTRGTGTVQYKITPTAMYVNWQAVGYFNIMTDKVNTFQLIITDGTDPILPAGNNIAFCYGDMQWTTGSASSGVGGFGGVPATVGVNKGDGVNFIQMGRFDQPGAAYDGPYVLNDGVSWLDNQSFYFNSCTGNNIAPIASINPPLLGGGGACDTLKVCGVNDTLVVSALFLSPEIGQTTNIAVNLYGTPGFSVINNIPGNSATADVQIISSAANAGLNVITFTATDDGTPAGVTVVNVNIFVDTTGFAAFNPLINGVLDFCQGGSTTLNVTPTTYDAYLWNSGSTGFSIVADSSGQYYCTARKNGCFKTVLVDVVEHPLPTPVILGDLFTCFSNPTTLYVDSASLYSPFLWSNASTNSSINVLNGTYTVTVTDSFGCVGTSPPVNVVNANPAVTISGVAPFCPGDGITLTAVPTIPVGASYTWSTSDTTNTTTVNGTGDVIVTIDYTNGCSTADTVSIIQFSSPTAEFTSSPLGVSNPSTTVNFSDLSSVPSPATITTWVWNFGDSIGVFYTTQNPTHVYNLNGTYVVTLAVQSSNGCWDTIRHEYTIVSNIEAPNVFTPNNDGKNDLLIFKNLEFFPNSNLTVFNRWGNKVFEKTDYQNNWNGGGQKDGVYYYILSAPKLEKPLTGYVQILH